VLTINASWSSTCRMAGALVTEPGEGGFPGPEAMLDYGDERLREQAKLSIRAATVATATRRLLADGVIDASGEGPPERLDYDYLVSLKAIGPYARMLRRDFSRLPVDFRRDRPSAGAIRLRPHGVLREPVLLGSISGTWLQALPTAR
jgi:hypothetical protein